MVDGRDVDVIPYELIYRSKNFKEMELIAFISVCILGSVLIARYVERIPQSEK